ncbi:MAG: hypothetical protein ABJF10_13170 [Chthoniobacter sp.]|uniref:hypothetical protein n=1 Tax=Chthoniobacter sp. TaxID=2510640 RepID=UPI0032A786D2
MIFIVPLQSPQVSRDWGHVSRLAVRGLSSICQQTKGDFRVFLICNEPPAGLKPHPALTVIAEDFPVPFERGAARMHDKWRKVKRGLIVARDFAPAHYMCVDADDCVHRDLAAFADARPHEMGWFMETGYMHDEGSRWLFRRAQFEATCGSSSIVRCELADLPSSMEDDDEQFPILRFGHSAIRAGMIELGRPLAELPFIGAIYNTGTGENDSEVAVRSWRGARMLLQKITKSRLLTTAVREQFGLYELES